jgi:segregation and condensation protein B
MNPDQIKNIVEASLLAAGRPLSIDDILALFDALEGRPERSQIREALDALREDYAGRGIELTEVSSGIRIQVRKEFGEWIGRLWAERPGRYSRALLETLALVVYRQPITRGEIEDVRGVSVSSSIMKTLQEREWIRVLGHREVPGRPAMYGTTREFLDHFNLKSLDELPPLADLRDLDRSHADLFEAAINSSPEEHEPPAGAETEAGQGQASAPGIPPAADGGAPDNHEIGAGDAEVSLPGQPVAARVGVPEESESPSGGDDESPGAVVVTVQDDETGEGDSEPGEGDARGSN